jgi:hypothetical protein
MKSSEVLAELVVGLVVIPLHGGLLDGPLHPLDLAVRRGKGPPDLPLALLTLRPEVLSGNCTPTEATI